jgi:nucleoside phosphorylase
MMQRIDFAIVTPLEEERSAMLRHLSGARLVPGQNGGPRVYYSAEIPVSFLDGHSGTYNVIVSDLLFMGRVDAAIVVKDIMRRWQPRFVILTGIAGGFGRAGVKLGDILIADQIVDPENQKLTPEGREIRWSVHRVHPGLLAAAKELRPEHWHPANGRPEAGTSRRHIGPVCTGDKVVADGSLEKLAKDWPKLIGVEMEAGGAANAAYQSNPAPGFLMIRGVSDLADQEKDAARTHKWRSYASDVAANFVAALLRSAPVPLRGSAQDAHRKANDTELRCPRCGKRAMKVHSRSDNEFVLTCRRCSTNGILKLDGSKIQSFIVPGVITLIGIIEIDDWLHAHHYGSIVDALLDITDHLPDLLG